jgi:spermidine synthase
MNTPYPLFPVAVITVLAYIITWWFSEWGMMRKQVHRKFWNILLLAAFLVAGLFGLLSVIKINYKLDIPQYDQILRWHVIFGIGMVIISFFHFSWHWKYYFSQSREKTAISDTRSVVGYSLQDQQGFRYLLFLLGTVAMISQVVLIREFISVLAGNELIVGVVMAVWMLLTGWGAFHARHRIVSGFKLVRGMRMLIALTLMPAVVVVLLYWLKSQMFPPGTLIGLGTSVTGTFLLLFPGCFLSGYLFTAFSTCLSLSREKNLISRAYSVESLGSLIGGLIFSLFLGRFFNSFQILGLTTGVVCLAVAWILVKYRSGNWLISLVSGILIPVLVFVFNPDMHIKKMFYPNQEIIMDRGTSYGNLVVTQQSGQVNFYENNALQFYTDNLTLCEEAVHFVLSQHENPKQILLISGGISGMIREIRKYDVQKIVYLETNPEIFSHWKHLSDYTDHSGTVEFIKEDIRTFLRKTKKIYDIILINLPPPSTLGYNRFYTEEFFVSVKKHCNEKSVICASLPSTANYAEDNALEVNASLWKTLEKQYRHLLLLPGEKNYFLASDNPLSADITKLIDEKGIENEYVNRYYFDDELLLRRGQELVAGFGSSGQVNRDFYPYMFIRETDHWLSHFSTSYYMLVLVPVFLFLLCFFRFDRVSMGLYTGGFTSASLEIVFLLAYQVFFGSIYLATAFFFTVFMAGLALGSFWENKRWNYFNRKYYASLQFLLALFSLLVPVFIFLTGRITGMDSLSRMLFFILVFVLAFIVGHEFKLASHLQTLSYSKTSGINYSTDLAGSAFGSFLTPIVLLPVFGLVYTCVMVAGLNLFSGFLALRIRN